MLGLEIKKLENSFGALKVLKGIDLEIEEGEFVVFVGRSGCGKSTLLRVIAGLETISSGEILIEGNDVTRLHPSKRGIAMVFQSYALYPHMTVRENIGFGLKLAKVPSSDRDGLVGKAADILQMTDYLDKCPAQLSGGQRQRVAIGRAIVRDPKVFLFDEPLSNLDADLRVQMRSEFIRLRSSFKSHDDIRHS